MPNPSGIDFSQPQGRRASRPGLPLLCALLLLLARPDLTLAATGSIWSIIPSANPSTTSLSNDVLAGVSAISDRDVWAVGSFNSTSNGVIDQTLAEHWNGTAWSLTPTPNVGSLGSQLFGVSARNSSDVWAVGEFSASGSVFDPRTLIEHFDGTRWSVVPSPNPSPQDDVLNGVVALAADNAWAVGWYDNPAGSALAPLILHWDGTAWSVMIQGLPTGASGILQSVTAISPNDVWAVGESAGDGSDFETHWNGAAWKIAPRASFPNGGQVMLRGVAAAGSADVWAVGSYAPTVTAELQTLALHWDGSTWSKVTTPNVDVFFNLLYGVAAINTGDVWAVGYAYTPNGLNFHTLVENWNGQQWSIVPSPNVPGRIGRSDELTGVTRSGPTSLWAVGTFDSLAKGNPGIRTLSEHTTDG